MVEEQDRSAGCDRKTKEDEGRLGEGKAKKKEARTDLYCLLFIRIETIPIPLIFLDLNQPAF
jgi:hypothetical protein